MAELLVRPAVDADLPALYNHYVEETPFTFDLEPFEVEARRPWFAQFGATGRHRLFVAVEGDRLWGYASSTRFRVKAAYETSVETTIYLARDQTGRGLGSRLYATLFVALAEEDVHRAYAGITLPNEASVALHSRFGFTEVSIFRQVGRKFERFWDVAWYAKPV